jgi:hypothetical protein
MTCADLEILLCDYLDGKVASEERARVQQHLAGCSNCAALARDAAAAVEFMGRAEEIEPPPELMTRILFNLPPAHHARQRKRFADLVRGWVQPMLQPKLAMGFAMTIVSLSLLGGWAHINPRQLTLDDLRPARVWQSVDDRIYRTWQRTVKFYENLRLVYEVQTQIKEWKQREQELRGRAADKPAAADAAPQPGAGGTRPSSPATNDARKR